MAISAGNLTVGSVINTTVTAGTTASFTPTANNLILVSVASRTSIGTGQEPNQPTLTGNGLTYVAIGSLYYDNTSSSRKKLTVFRALGASPTTGSVVFDFAGQTQTDITWGVDQFSGVDTSGANGAGALVQTGQNTFPGTFGGGSVSVTLSAFSNSSNAGFGVIVDDAGLGAAPTVGNGFTALSSIPAVLDMTSEWELSTSTLIFGTTSTSAGQSAGVFGAEIKAATVVASSFRTFKTLLGVGNI